MNTNVEILPEFNPVTDLPDHFFGIFYGVRRSGKTVLLRWMMDQLKERLKYTEVYVICATLETNSEQYDWVPPAARFSDVENIEYRLKNIIEAQKKKVKEYKDSRGGKLEFKKMYDSDDEDSDDDEKALHMQHQSKSRTAAMKEINDPDGYAEISPVLVILDDVISESTVRTSPSLRLLAVGGRHLLISCVILSQVVSGSGSVPPAVRTQCDFIGVVANPRSSVERELLAVNYLTPVNANKQIGLEILGKVTEVPHRALIISTVSADARSYADFSFRCGPVPFPPTAPDFKMGTPAQWSYSMKTKKPKSKELPSPFKSQHDLPINVRTGEYLRGISEECEDLFW